MSAKKKFLIIFFSILPFHILVAVLLVAPVAIEQKKERLKIEEIIDSVEVDDRFAYRHLSSSIGYKNQDYGNYIVDNADIETDFVCEDYIVYRLTRYKRYDYYSIDSNGYSKFLMTTKLALSFKYYKDNAFYMMNEDDFFVYDIKTEAFNEISFNDYCIALGLSYYVSLNRYNLIKVYAVNNSRSKVISFDELSQNEVIDNLYRSTGLFFKDYFIMNNTLFITIYIDAYHGIVVEYNILDESFDVVDKIIEMDWSNDFILFYLENGISYPMEYLLAGNEVKNI